MWYFDVNKKRYRRFEVCDCVATCQRWTCECECENECEWVNELGGMWMCYFDFVDICINTYTYVVELPFVRFSYMMITTILLIWRQQSFDGFLFVSRSAFYFWPLKILIASEHDEQMWNGKRLKSLGKSRNCPSIKNRFFSIFQYCSCFWRSDFRDVTKHKL